MTPGWCGWGRWSPGSSLADNNRGGQTAGRRCRCSPRLEEVSSRRRQVLASSPPSHLDSPPFSAAHTSHTSNYQPWESWENNILQRGTSKRHHDVLRSNPNIRRTRNQMKEGGSKSAAVGGQGEEAQLYPCVMSTGRTCDGPLKGASGQRTFA